MDSFDQDLKNRLLTAENLLLAAQQRIQALDHRLATLEKEPRRDYGSCDFLTTLIVVVTPKTPSGSHGCLEEVIEVGSLSEAEKKQAEIMAKRNSRKRKVLIATETSFKPVPF